MNEAGAGTIPRKRLEAYADAAGMMGDLRGLATTIQQVCADIAILEGEGRASALTGAEWVLAGVVRRLCATDAASDEMAKTEVDVLASVKPSYRESRGGLLMAAMIDAAIGLETERWLASSAQH